MVLLLVCFLMVGCRISNQHQSLVIWVTGGLQGEWLPHGEVGQLESGGLLGIARALELYREPGDLLVDLGRFRYPPGITGQNRAWRIRTDGFLKALARMDYTAMNVSLLDLNPWPPELSALAQEYDLPIISSNVGRTESLFLTNLDLTLSNGKIVQFIGFSGGEDHSNTLLHQSIPEDVDPSGLQIFRILLTDACLNDIQNFCSTILDIDMVIRLSDNKSAVSQIQGIPVLEMGGNGRFLGRLEIMDISPGGMTLDKWDFSDWIDHNPYIHHPVRERIRSTWVFWRKKPLMRAFLWEVPASMSPQQLAQLQMNQSMEEERRYSDLQALHREIESEYAGPQNCLRCHTADHPRNLLQFHRTKNTDAIARYPVYERCLTCHATGFEEPGGFLLPWERTDLLEVTCEACHGPAYEHSVQGELPYPPLPAEEICQSCHLSEYQPYDHP